MPIYDKWLNFIWNRLAPLELDLFEFNALVGLQLFNCSKKLIYIFLLIYRMIFAILSSKISIMFFLCKQSIDHVPKSKRLDSLKFSTLFLIENSFIIVQLIINRPNSSIKIGQFDNFFDYLSLFTDQNHPIHL